MQRDAGDVGSIPGSGRSCGGGNGNLLQYSCLENPRGQRSLVGYRQQGHKELDMTERLSTHACKQIIFKCSTCILYFSNIQDLVYNKITKGTF